ncbi:phosphoribosylanthranilate isomerase [Neobacillus vireti]|uniref:N-(5'-phosphoribosyl)anthranilate isomerase n=1 Tax=Neobacillus vireti LMG 21834 TaxID=1131730 RepID=A0AB94ILK5_9BACI|nr:phosphoribosylanthranilate isomerase [Neobacillus vireti]ETI67914.1 N-(5'-phosphoribosyl)anthranilate isomerase [Neobacillus vireti LMG 21834]KLT17334.1 N-(5'-phosphoribosyl)anthranilate isomerase [Neobacillus vireti]
MRVKICGIMDVNTARVALDYGADALGFVFAESKRKILPEIAGEIISQLPKEVIKVGVFVNETKDEIERIAAIAGLTHIQLHGDETEVFSSSLSLPVIKAISFHSNEELAGYFQYPCEYLLLDGPKGKYRGGNGTAFAWSEVNPTIIDGKKVILAGGLHVGNIEAAIKTIRPCMVDVSSGVETEGVKDFRKIKEFIKKAKGAI